MKKTDSFLTDLGLDMLAIFNNKIAEWSLTNPIEKASDTEGGAKFILSDFKRLEKLLDLPVRSDTDFIPNDLLDFDPIPDVPEQMSNDKSQISKARASYFFENKKSVSKEALPEKGSIAFQNSSFNRTGIVENDAGFDGEKRVETTENTEKLPKILRGGKNENFEENGVSESVIRPDKEAGFLEKSVFTDIELEKSVFTDIETNRKEETAVSTIWQKPLGNLGAFAALSNSPPMPTEKPNDVLLSPAQQKNFEEIEEYEHREGARQKQQTIENQTPSKRTQEVFNNQDARLFNSTFYEEEHLIQAENIEFEPIERERQQKYTESMTDTDDLLDALTERVRRDFQRFYP